MAAVKEELRAQQAHAGPGEYRFPERRVLAAPHFDEALREISASISEDMSSLQATRKFDERYGDAGRSKKRRHMGFGLRPAHWPASEDAQIRQGGSGA